MANRICFVELPASATAAAKDFYAAAFDFAMTDFGPTYACTMSGDVDLGLQADPGEATRAPLPVIQVESLEATEVLVRSAGGVITRPAFAFPGGRRFHFRDPAGNELAAMQAG
jgi:predicted enzyme related to lactoylglutathione lyase